MGGSSFPLSVPPPPPAPRGALFSRFSSRLPTAHSYRIHGDPIVYAAIVLLVGDGLRPTAPPEPELFLRIDAVHMPLMNDGTLLLSALAHAPQAMVVVVV